MQANNSYSDVLNTGFRQVETVQLAPDALLFINGSSTMKDENGNPFQIREDITEINTNLNIDAVPGTANFTISVPDHGVKKYRVNQYRGGIQVMNEIEIYFRGRFLKNEVNLIPKNSQTIIDSSVTNTKSYKYYPAFWGFVQATSESYSDGVFTISISCADMLRWWQITNTNINPSILSTTESYKNYMVNVLGVDPKDFDTFTKGNKVTSKITGKPITIYGTTLAGLTVPETFQYLSTISASKNFAPTIEALQAEYQRQSITQELSDSASQTDQMKYWNRRFNMISNGLRVYNLYTNTQKRLDIKFNSPSGTITPEILVPTAPPLLKSEMKSLLDIAKQAAESINFEFFQDVTGELILKPAFWNMDVTKNTPNSIIDDIDIINYGITQSESEIITRVDVSGSISEYVHYGDPIHGMAYDPTLMLRYGERVTSRQMDWLHSSEACKEWATVELAKQNASVRQGTITIIGRPELRLGYPVYVPSRDCFYYIKGIDHHFSFGGTFTTTLSLTAERRKLVDEQNNALVNGLFSPVGEIIDDQVPIQGTSVAEPIDDNNFVKQMYFPNICTPKAIKPNAVVKPNFTVNVAKTIADKTANWQTVSSDQTLAQTKNVNMKSVAVIQNGMKISDKYGYELIGVNSSLFDFGESITITGSAVDTTGSPLTSTREKASAAVNFNEGDNKLTANPDNKSLTLDQIENTMLVIGAQDTNSKATGLNNVNNDFVGPVYNGIIRTP